MRLRVSGVGGKNEGDTAMGTRDLFGIMEMF